MEYQQNLNLITRILKQTVGLQHMCIVGKSLSLLSKESNKPIFHFCVCVC